jgi:hypothetical protein
MPDESVRLTLLVNSTGISTFKGLMIVFALALKYLSFRPQNVLIPITRNIEIKID